MTAAAGWRLSRNQQGSGVKENQSHQPHVTHFPTTWRSFSLQSHDCVTLEVSWLHSSWFSLCLYGELKVNRLTLCSFPKEAQSGLLEVISPSQYYYPNLSSLTETFGDSKDRVKYICKHTFLKCCSCFVSRGDSESSASFSWKSLKMRRIRRC